MKGWTRRTRRILLAAGMAGCAGGPTIVTAPPPAPVDSTAVPAGPAPVHLGEAEVRAIAEIMQMEDLRALDPARMAVLGSHWSPQVRQRAALAWGRVHDPSHVEPLLEMLDDTAMAVRVNAAFALGLLADASARAVPELARLARAHAADSLGMEAAAALARTAAPAAFDTLLAILDAPAMEANPVIAEALLGLWRFGPRTSEAIETARSWAEHPDPAIRWRAIYPLVRTSAVAAAPLLLRMTSDPDHSVRAIALRALRSATADSAGIRDAALAALRSALADGHPHVRVNALGALATYDSVGVDDIEPLLDDPDGNVRMAAVNALAAAGGGRALDRLEDVADNADERTGIRVAALAGLARADAARAAITAAVWAKSERWYERMVAARTLAAAPWPDTRVPLTGLAEDPSARVASAALAAIGAAAGETQAGQPVFLRALRSTQPRVRAAAITAIGRRASAADIAVLMDAYDQARRDSTPDAALAAVNALGAIARDGAPVEHAFFARFDPHPDAEVRRAVRRRLGDGWGEEPDERTDRGVAFYEDVVRTLVAPALAGEPGPVLRITTPDGPIDIALAAADAPLTVHNIISLVQSGYYDSNGDADARRWHRVVPNFVLQDGEPGDGSGGPGYSIRDEINRLRYERGVLGMALSGPDTGGGQFFITHSPQPHLDGGYTIFGRVLNGMAAADAVVQDDRILGMEVLWR